MRGRWTGMRGPVKFILWSSAQPRLDYTSTVHVRLMQDSTPASLKLRPDASPLQRFYTSVSSRFLSGVQLKDAGYRVGRRENFLAIFTAWRLASAICAVILQCPSACPYVCLSVYLSWVGVLSKRLDIASSKHQTTPIALWTVQGGSKSKLLYCDRYFKG